MEDQQTEKMELPPLKKIFSGADSSAPDAPRNRFNLKISPRMALILGVILVCAVGWSFFMGFMVGRGQNPQAGIHEITGLLPLDKNSPSTLKIEPSQATGAESATQGDNDGKTKNLPSREGALSASLPQAPDDGNKKSPLSFTRPQDGQKEAWENPGRMEPARPAVQKTVDKPQNSGTAPQFTYAFQTAAFRTRGDAEKQRSFLKAHGTRGTIQKSGKMFLVVVNLRGGENDANAFRQKMRALKLGTPLLLSRKQITASPKKPDLSKSKKTASANRKPAAQARKAKQP